MADADPKAIVRRLIDEVLNGGRLDGSTSCTRRELPDRNAGRRRGLARLVIEGFGEYRWFAPDGWSPPPLAEEVGRLHELLPDDDVWCRLAESDGELVGQVTFVPAARHWSAGVATTLHAAAIAEARDRGYSQMRLFTPAQQRRARRFYEREGWSVAGDEFHDPGPDLVIVEYRRALRGA